MRYSVSDVFDMLGEESLNISEVKGPRESIEVEGFKVYRRSMRYATFYQKGCKCAHCGKQGTYFQLDADREGNSSDSRRHFNLYAEDGTLMTKDHILPKKWGGTDTIDNFQTLCKTCNELKGSIYEAEIEGIIATKSDNIEKVINYVSLSDAIYDICKKTHIFSKGSKPSTVAKKSIQIALKISSVLDTDIQAYGYYWKHGKFTVGGEAYRKDNTNA